MKKRAIYWLLLVECSFAALLVGFFLSKNLNRTPIQVSKLPQATYASETSAAESTAATELQGKVNINTATSEELEALPGIGPTLAKRIIAYRQQNGYFSTLLDLTKVDGIGLERVNQIMDYATVGG